MCDLQISSLTFEIKGAKFCRCKGHRHALKISPSRVVKWIGIVNSGWKTIQSVPNVSELVLMEMSSERHAILDVKAQLQDVGAPQLIYRFSVL